MIDFVSKHKWAFIALLSLMILYMLEPSKGVQATQSTLNNFKSVGMILPPIFVLIGLLDTWVPREVMVKFMGNRSGFVGGMIAVLLGAMGAGPLYVAFPIAAILIKKGARLAYVFLFLSAWVSVKLPIFMYEWASFGGRFTLLHVVSSLFIYSIGSFMMERFLSLETKSMIEERAEALSA